MLERFRQAKAPEIAALRRAAERGELPAPRKGRRHSLAHALRGPRKERGVAVIAEYKRASPSKGVINLGLGPEEVARIYAEAGAAAMSVLTETDYFQGELGYLARCQDAAPGLPLLRKDFLMDPLQVTATAATPAAAGLLIARMLPGSLLAEMLSACQAARVEAVVEVFNQTDLALARTAGASIIQVNTRDLDTLELDPSAAKRLVADKRPHELWIAASGIKGPEEVTAYGKLGYDGVLVGTAIMAQTTPEAMGEALSALVAAGRRARPDLKSVEDRP